MTTTPRSPTYEVKIRNLAFSDFNQQVATAIAGGTTPDLMIVDNPDNARFAASGALADLTLEGQEWGQADQFLPGPWNSDPVGRQDVRHPARQQHRRPVDQHGSGHGGRARPGQPTKDLGRVRHLGREAMTNKDVGVYGTALLAKKDETGTFLFLPWILQNGGSIDKLDSPEAIEALAFWHEPGRPGLGAQVGGQRRLRRDLPAVHDRQGRHDDQRDLERSVHRYGRARPPLGGRRRCPYTKQPASSLGGENWAVFASAKQQDGAWDFLKFVTDPAYGTKLTDCMGYMPSRKDVLAQVAERSADDPTMQVFLKQMESAAARGPLPNWSEASAVIQDALQAALSGQKSPEQAMQDAASQMSIDPASEPRRPARRASPRKRDRCLPHHVPRRTARKAGSDVGSPPQSVSCGGLDPGPGAVPGSAIGVCRTI